MTTTLENAHVPNRLEQSWYDLVAAQLQALTEAFAVDKASGQLHRACELICKEALQFSPGRGFDRPSRLNNDGTPVQFAFSTSHDDQSLQFLSEIAGPGLFLVRSIELAITKIRRLSMMLHLAGDPDSIAALLYRMCAPGPQRIEQTCECPFWLGAGVSRNGRLGIKIYINGKMGDKNCQWERFDQFAAFLGVSNEAQNLRQLLAGHMSPLGMAICLNQVGNPTGRIYLSSYGKRVSYYEDLLRNFVSTQNVSVFSRYSELMMGEDYAYPTQNVVFSVGLNQQAAASSDVKIEFCGHCLFKDDRQARNRCLRWLGLRGFDACLYEKMLAVIAPQLSGNGLNTHMFLGVGWKKQAEYTTIYLKPDFETASA